MTSPACFAHEQESEAPRATNAPPIWDRAAALERADGDEELMQEITALFLEDSPGLLKEIQEAVAVQAADRLYRTAHTLKGSAGSIGAVAVARAAQHLEMMGRGQNLAGAGEASDLLKRELDRLVAVLRRDESVPSAA